METPLGMAEDLAEDMAENIESGEAPPRAMTVEEAGQRRRTRRWLVRLLAALAAVTLAISSVLIFRVVPEASRESQSGLAEVAAIGDLETLVAAQANDQRAYLLTGRGTFLVEFNSRRQSFDTSSAALSALASTPERQLLQRAVADYRLFIAEHGKVVAAAAAGNRDEAIAISFGVGRDHRLAAERHLHALHGLVVRESKGELQASQRRVVGLTLCLLVLSVVPAIASFVLGRTLRRTRDEEAAIAERARLAHAERVAHLGSWEHRVKGNTFFWSDELYRIFGFEPGAIEPSLEAFLERVHPDDAEEVGRRVGQSMVEGGTFDFVSRIVRTDGEVRWLESQGEVTLGPDGRPVGVVGIGLDVTERQEADDQVRRARDRLAEQASEMRHRAYHDGLTGLANRALLLERLEEARGAGSASALLLLDLDGFKRVNDSLGHAVGDELLKLVGQRLSQAVRGRGRGTRPPDTVARLGGDEFAMLLVDVDEDGAAVVAERVLAECRQPFRIGGRELLLSGSLGIVTTDWASGVRDIVRDADVAMYHAKEAGGGRCARFDPAMQAQLADRFALEGELRTAIEDGGLVLYYQPIADPRTGVVDKVEALVRWIHPTRGFLPPDTFIPLAEETGLIVALGAWVLDEACRELVRLSEASPDLRMAVNLSGRQLEDADIAATVSDALARHGLDASRLVLEVTETLLMEREATSLAALEQLQSLGVCLAIDDFGTGYSSLSRLRTLPVAELKIDKSFIDEVDAAGEQAPVVAAIIALAHGLGHQVVAEGVEDAAQLAALVRLGCDRVQGYLLSRPLPAGELHGLMADAAPFAELVKPAEVIDPRIGDVMSAVEKAVGGSDNVRQLLAELSRLTGLESAYLTRIDFDADEQEIVAAHNQGAMQIDAGLRVPWEDTICRRALAGGPHATSDVHADYAGSVAAAELGMTGYAMAPVVDRAGAVVGTLCAATATGRPVDDGTRSLLEVFSRLIGEAVSWR